MFSFDPDSKLPCFTQSRVYLGRLFEVEKDENGQVINYLVKTKFSLRSKFGKTLSIASVQVIKITPTEIVVNDSYIQEPEQEAELMPAL